MSGTRASERADAIVVGARCAGSAAAIALARAGRRVVALDRVSFPADTISTHLLWPGGLAEIQALGALPGVEAIGAPRMHIGFAAAAGLEVRGTFTAIHGIDYAMCVRRIALDAELVAAAREAGAVLREGARVKKLLRDRGRVAGVRYENAEGEAAELRAPLVIGADGRRSTVARLTGASEPYRSSPSGRACYYAYWRDADPAWRGVAAQWREGTDLGTAFPCDEGLVLVLLQPAVERIEEFRADLVGTYRETVGRIPGLRERLDGCELVTKVRSATGIESYFRRSTGPGWALAGDAGHFKDPVTAQGIRDALRHGRLLGEGAAPVLDDPTALDAALETWELARERDCLAVYQWTNRLARGEEVTPLEVEMYREAAGNAARARKLLDVFSRTRPPSAMFSVPAGVRLTVRGLLRRGADRRALLGSAGRELANAIVDAAERARARPSLSRAVAANRSVPSPAAQELSRTRSRYGCRPGPPSARSRGSLRRASAGAR